MIRIKPVFLTRSGWGCGEIVFVLGFLSLDWLALGIQHCAPQVARCRELLLLGLIFLEDKLLQRLVELLIDENVVVVAGLQPGVLAFDRLELGLDFRQLLVEIVDRQLESLDVQVVLLHVVKVDGSKLADLLVLENAQLLDRLVHKIADELVVLVFSSLLPRDFSSLKDFLELGPHNHVFLLEHLKLLS